MNASHAHIFHPHPTPLAACLAVALVAADATAGIAVPVAAPHSGATRSVTNCNDSGAGSLRAAVSSAQSGDTIDLSGLTCGTITLATGAIQTTADDLTLHGPGATALTIAGGSKNEHDYSVLDHFGSGTLHIDSLRMTDPRVFSIGDFPHPSFCISSDGSVDVEASVFEHCARGGIYAHNGVAARYTTISESFQGITTRGGDVSIRSSTISDNSGFRCVALDLGNTEEGSVLISDSTISGNFGSYNFPIYPAYSAGCIRQAVTIQNSTIAFNNGANPTAAAAGAMYISASKPAAIESSILANNGLWDLRLSGPIAGHNNLIVATNAVVPSDTLLADPKLLPLADNGGPTRTHALAAGSPAIDAGNNVANLQFDQRGATRMRGAAADIGAYEVQAGETTVSIGAGFTGHWFDAEQSGHGFSIEVLPDNVLLAEWFVFAPQGGQAWIQGMGPITGNSAVLQGYRKVGSGGLFPPAFDAAQLQNEFWGTITLTFTDCNNGTASWQPVAAGYTAGSMPLQRLTLPAGLACP